MHLTITVPTSVYSWGKIIQETVTTALKDLNGTRGPYRGTAPLRMMRRNAGQQGEKRGGGEKKPESPRAQFGRHLQGLRASLNAERASRDLKDMGAIDHMSSRTVWPAEVFWVLQHQVGLNTTIKLAGDLHRHFAVEHGSQPGTQASLEALCKECHDARLGMRHIAEAWRRVVLAGLEGHRAVRVGDLIPHLPMDWFAQVSIAKILLKHRLVEVVQVGRRHPTLWP